MTEMFFYLFFWKKLKDDKCVQNKYLDVIAEFPTSKKIALAMIEVMGKVELRTRLSI